MTGKAGGGSGGETDGPARAGFGPTPPSPMAEPLIRTVGKVREVEGTPGGDWASAECRHTSDLTGSLAHMGRLRQVDGGMQWGWAGHSARPTSSAPWRVAVKLERQGKELTGVAGMAAMG